MSDVPELKITLSPSPRWPRLPDGTKDALNKEQRDALEKWTRETHDTIRQMEAVIRALTEKTKSL